MSNIQYPLLKEKAFSSGFTLIELLVSVAIVGLMSAVTVRGFIGAKQSGQLAMDAQTIVSDARRAQGYALGLKSFQGDFSNARWGLHFQKGSSTYQIFADLNGDAVYGTGERYQEMSLSSGAVIGRINNNASIASLDIVYVPPNPVAIIRANGAGVSKATSSVEVTKFSGVKNIYFNRLGMVDLASVAVADESDFGWHYDTACLASSTMGDGSYLAVRSSNIAGTISWKNSNSNCDPLQCGQSGGQSGDNLVAGDDIDFSDYPARNACKAVGGRLATIGELACIYDHQANYGMLSATGIYWSSTEESGAQARALSFDDGGQNSQNKTMVRRVRCVRGW